MSLIKDIISLFDQKDRIKLLWIFFIIIAITFFEAISFAAVIPVFKTVFLNEIPSFIDNYFTNFLNLIEIRPFNTDYKLGTSSLKKFIIIIVFILIFLIKSIILILFTYFLSFFFGNFCIKISNKVFFNCINQDYLFFIEHTVEDFLRKVTTDIHGVKTYVVSVINFFIEILFILTVSVVLIIINYQIFLFIIGIFGTVFSFYFYIMKRKISVWSFLFQKNSGLLQNLISDVIKGIKYIICYKLEKKYLSDFSKRVNNVYLSQFKLDFVNTIQRFWMELLAVVAMSLPLVFFMYKRNDVQELIPVFGLYCPSIVKCPIFLLL